MEKKFIRKQSELKKVDYTKQAEDATDLLIKEAKKAGYDSVLDYVKHVYRTWDKEVQLNVLSELYDTFLDHIQAESDKEPYGKGKWNSSSTFLEYLEHTRKECKRALEEELPWLKKTKKPSFQGLVPFLPNMTNVPKGVGEPLSQENYEFFELIYRRTLELVEMLLVDPDAEDSKYKRMMGEIEARAKLNFQVDKDIEKWLE